VNPQVEQMKAVIRLLRLALPLADASESHLVAANIDTAIDASSRRLSELRTA
jgi:hypothetical protein